MRFDPLFAQFGELAAKLQPLEFIVVYSSLPRLCTLRVGAAGVVG